ncbi:MAG: peptidylprolyl isomerase [Sphingomonadaceae bacterium]|nr:peptidylprolyl isomerase [Sphingomonadaceae bacterium]
MRNTLLATAALALSLPLAAQDGPAPSPGEIVAQAAAGEWVAIPAEQLLVMTLAPDVEGNARQVTIQLMPPPFSQGWIDNIRLFARSGWYDGISVNRVQDNYVVQWGDPNYDNPEATGETKPLPEGLKVVGEAEYSVSSDNLPAMVFEWQPWDDLVRVAQSCNAFRAISLTGCNDELQRDQFAWANHLNGWPIANNGNSAWPTHCYGMVGVGRNLSPDTGSGAELYTVIGHAPRHLDRNIALVGRVIEGMEHLSSLPRGKGALGFYGPDEVHKRTPILTVRVASDLPSAEQPRFEYLSTEGETFARYAEARANRRDPFFNVPAGGADICNIPVPVRRVAE